MEVVPSLSLRLLSTDPSRSTESSLLAVAGLRRRPAVERGFDLFGLELVILFLSSTSLSSDEALLSWLLACWGSSIKGVETSLFWSLFLTLVTVKGDVVVTSELPVWTVSQGGTDPVVGFTTSGCGNETSASSWPSSLRLSDRRHSSWELVVVIGAESSCSCEATRFPFFTLSLASCSETIDTLEPELILRPPLLIDDSETDSRKTSGTYINN